MGSVLIFRDVTEERKESLVKKNFLSLISHKLKTPLVTINGYGPLLLESPGLGEFEKKAVLAITKQGCYLLGLVEKLLHFTMIDGDGAEPAGRPVRIGGAAERAVASLAAYLEEKGVKVEIRGDLKGLPAVIADDMKAEASIRNLVENAVKFNPKASKTVTIGAARSDGYAGVFVEDDGPGIPPEEREKIFQRFYQIEESFTGQVEGAGLGLALVKRVADAHGGKVELESRLGAGSKFSLLFPVAGEEE
jgi:two-component system phosphate regulon sensor histidine kinase PhoR